LKTAFLEFEQAIADLEAKIEELRFVQDDSPISRNCTAIGPMPTIFRS
jgi:hypothetical protein